MSAAKEDDTQTAKDYYFDSYAHFGKADLWLTAFLFCSISTERLTLVLASLLVIRWHRHPRGNDQKGGICEPL